MSRTLASIFSVLQRMLGLLVMREKRVLVKVSLGQMELQAYVVSRSSLKNSPMPSSSQGSQSIC
jgi:hypothetical protein